MKSRENRQQYWQIHLKEYYQSGLSQREYCRQADIGYWSFNQWKRRIEKSQETASITGVKSRPAVHDSTSTTDMIVIRLNKSIQILLPASISHETLTVHNVFNCRKSSGYIFRSCCIVSTTVYLFRFVSYASS